MGEIIQVKQTNDDHEAVKSYRYAKCAE